MSGLSIRSLRQLAIGSSQAVRPLAPTTTMTSASTRTLAARAVSTASVQATRLPKPKKPTTATPKSASPSVVPYKRYRQPKPELTKFSEGHGEQIWVYNNIVTNQVVYSHTPVLRVRSPNLSHISIYLAALTHALTEQPRTQTAAVQRQEDEAGQAAQGLLAAHGADPVQ